MKLIFPHIHKLVALASSIQSKLRIRKKRHNRKPTRTKRKNRKPRTTQSLGQLKSLTIQNRPILRMNRADYLGLAMLKENRATKVDSYW